VKFQLDDMQAAMPNLRVLKLSALGGHLYGEQGEKTKGLRSMHGTYVRGAMHVGYTALACNYKAIELLHGKKCTQCVCHDDVP
jgi:hypothetical protein